MPGDPQRTAELLQASGRRLFALLSRLTLRADVAEELLQELFLRLQSSDAFDKANNAEAYAYRVAVRLAFDWRRRQRRHQYGALVEGELVDTLPLAEQVTADREEFERILQAMAGLSTSTQHILTMHYIEQVSYQEIAEQLGTSAHRVRALAHKAVAKLRSILITTEQE